ncbi:hypothetical protein SN13_11655 [Vibrio alginolyticus]|uniref:hypothetical protein n=1 Tax=Vibrio TaxID=662 RepID=UPI0005ACCDC9|nr:MULTISPECIES: hypothetical protein [Vibrio]KIP66814.1 hypothetical protein SN12_22165 [Vibrio alginolyticus]KIP83077.1 hypothetical protein SN13_11655 [Vibrio alginolyticus]MDW1794101.1 hypothetical protein [Vibrio sp. Vb2297]
MRDANFKNKLNLLIESVGLHTFQLHVLTVMIAEYTKQSNDFSDLNRFVREIEDSESVIDWFHAYTPIRFNRKKKRFVARGSGRWDISSGLFSELIVSKKALLKRRTQFKLNSLDDLESVYSSIELRIAELDSQYKVDLSTISLSEIEQIQELSDKEKIKAYLAANPDPDSMGKFGVPQSKYRYGTYGSPAFNPWSR